MKTKIRGIKKKKKAAEKRGRDREAPGEPRAGVLPLLQKRRKKLQSFQNLQ
jgi:hypothetical protein